jgi:hypothetical protein
VNEINEIIARLDAIGSRLDDLDHHISVAQENCEAANERRCNDLDRIDRELRDGLSEVRYELDRVRSDVSRSSRVW